VEERRRRASKRACWQSSSFTRLTIIMTSHPIPSHPSLPYPCIHPSIPSALSLSWAPSHSDAPCPGVICGRGNIYIITYVGTIPSPRHDPCPCSTFLSLSAVDDSRVTRSDMTCYGSHSEETRAVVYLYCRWATHCRVPSLTMR